MMTRMHIPEKERQNKMRKQLKEWLKLVKVSKLTHIQLTAETNFTGDIAITGRIGPGRTLTICFDVEDE